MKKLLIAIFALLALNTPSTYAIESGSDAVGNSIVVQIHLTFTKNSSFCSGALIAPRVVATADHCIKLVGELQKDNQIQSAKVAPPGAPMDISIRSYVNVIDFIFSPNQGKNGIAYLILESPLEVKIPIRIAQAVDIDNLQNSKAPIKFFGYGSSSRSEPVYKNYPQGTEGELFRDLENSRVHLRSYPASPCRGDSGGPVIQQLESEILLIGLINGPWYVDLNAICSKEVWDPELVKQEKLYKYSVYIPLFTEVAQADAKLAADKVLATPVKTENSQLDYEVVMSDYKKLLIRISNLKLRYVKNTQLLAIEKKMLALPIKPGADLSTAVFNISSVNKKLDTSIKTWDQIYITIIECTKSGKIIKVTGKSPKCPTGYTKSK